ncbi:MAG: enoyl-CoA hydratase/isomerase family protein [Pseudomonadota bacterium]
MHDFETLKFEIEQGVAKIVLNRPKAANCLNPTMCEELVEIAKLCDETPEIRAILLTGEGRFFCAGGDVASMAADMEKVGRTVKTLADNLHTAISTFARMDAPLIVAVNGVAAGAGFSLAAIGDIVISSEAASFVMAYTKSGLSPDGSSSYFLPRLIGFRRTQELMLTNRTLTAPEALSWGLITEIVPPEALMERAEAVAASLAAGSKSANAAVKKLLLVSFDNGLETQMELEGRQISASASSPDGLEGISAFVDKRAPNFTR